MFYFKYGIYLIYYVYNNIYNNRYNNNLYCLINHLYKFNKYIFEKAHPIL